MEPQRPVDERRIELIQEIRTWIGTPWQHQGRLKGLGVDCIGLLLAAARCTGELTPEKEAELPANYSRLPSRTGYEGSFLKFMRTNMLSVKKEDVKVADVILVPWGAYPMHVGLLTDLYGHGGTGAPFGFLHSSARDERVLEHRFEMGMMAIRGFFRFRSFEEWPR